MKNALATAAVTLAATPVVAIAAAGGDPPPGGPPAVGPPAAAQAAPAAAVPAKAPPALVRFGSCGALIRYARRHATPRYHGGGGTGGPMAQPFDRGAPGAEAAPRTVAGPAPDASSRTNVQEAGVDEPDIVKTDGRHLFALARGVLHVVDAGGEAPRLVASLPVGASASDLLVHGARVLVVGQRFVTSDAPGRTAAVGASLVVPGWGAVHTVLTEIDASDPGAPKVVRTQAVDGNYVSARLTGRSARIVVTSSGRAQQERALARRASGWLPRSRFRSRLSGRRSTRLVSPCRRVRRASAFSGLDVLTVLTVDMGRGLPSVDADSVMTNAETVYASPDSLYVATERWLPAPTDPESRPPATTTAIHRFDASADPVTAYRASGLVRGFVLNQFSMSEHDGRLRVATTDTPLWWGGAERRASESFVSVLEEQNGALRLVGRVDGLGRGERIYSVRFIGDRGYVVTFRETDPLYTIDLSDPTAPRVRGELKILGYSAYLHPIGDDLLIGIGQDATAEGRTLGTQISLFDVSDPAQPTRLHAHRIESGADGSSSEAEYDHHAFLWWPAADLAVLPVSVHGADEPGFIGAIGFRVGRSAIEEAGRTAHRDARGTPIPIRRSLVIGGRLLTVSDAGVESADLAALARQHWVAFPRPDSAEEPVTR